ncbi:hypothetical protein AMTRI_Chr02g266300 [Amborella trichopoda]
MGNISPSNTMPQLSSSSLPPTMATFSVTKSDPVWVRPARDTPSSVLEFSRIDSQPAFRFLVKTIHVYKYGEEAAKKIREALAELLVPYYQFSGRLTASGEDGRLRLLCTGEGAGFVEGVANCRLEDIDYLDKLASEELYHLIYGDPKEIDMTPVALIQVTDFQCGGFAIGLQLSHCLVDGIGGVQFLSALAEMVKGADSPSVEPVWSRHLLGSAPPAEPIYPSRPPLVFPDYRLEPLSFDISAQAISRIKQACFEKTGKPCSSFEALAAEAWRLRNQAIGLELDQETTLVIIAGCRHLMDPPLPKGYFGNCFFPVRAKASGEQMLEASEVDVVTWIQEAKERLPSEFRAWLEGPTNGEDMEDPFQLSFSYNNLFLSEWNRLGFRHVDFGWGTAVHVLPILASYVIPAGVFVAPPEPKQGTRLEIWCVTRAHREAFLEEMKSLTSA